MDPDGSGHGDSDLPPGFHFFPSDEELVVHFLRRKAASPLLPNTIPTLHLRQCDPWNLTAGSALEGGHKFWYFFTARPDHGSTTRTTGSGYWETVAGADEVISTAGDDAGVKKTLKYYLGQLSGGGGGGVRTNWVMHEYHLLDSFLSDRHRHGACSRKRRQSESNRWVLCRVHESSSSGGSHGDDSKELSCLDEVFLALDDDDLDEVSFGI
ncbi:NAC domain-containing protein 104-like [Curcuma longa]|uniref:NAC domain-containing protein 104-like n=1 Tax=Curcuma longa TaxID=136217 RepID=UPI003D9E07D5